MQRSDVDRIAEVIMREDRLIRLGIAEATVTIRTIAKTVEAKP